MEEPKRKDGKEQVRTIEDAIKARSSHFHVNDIPTHDFELFKEIAKENFCNHYGLTISALLKEKLIFQTVLERLDGLEIELRKLKANQKPPEKKGVKLLNGKTIGGKE